MTDTEHFAIPKGFFDMDEARRHSAERRRCLAAEKIRSDACQSSRAAKAPIQHQASSPKWSAYQVAIPAGWKALLPVFYPVQSPHAVSDLQDSLSVVNLAFWRFQAGVLLCRQEADDQEAVREFEGGVLQEAAFLGSDGQYLQAAQARPTYGVVPLAAPSSTSTDQIQGGDCLVLLPLLESPHVAGKVYPPCRLFVDGIEVRFLGEETDSQHAETQGDH